MAKSGRFKDAGALSAETALGGMVDDRDVSSKPVIDAKDMARRKQRIMDQRWDTTIRLGQLPHLAKLTVKEGDGTYGVNGISIFSPYCPKQNLPNPEVFNPPPEITDEEVELYQMTEDDMEQLTRLLTMEQEMMGNQEAAELPVSFHASDVLARLDDTFGDLSLLTITEQAMVLNLLEFTRIVAPDMGGLDELNIETVEGADDFVQFTDSYGQTQMMRKGSLQKIQNLEEASFQHLDGFHRTSSLRKRILFLLFMVYVFVKCIFFGLHLTFATDARVYERALVSASSKI